MEDIKFVILEFYATLIFHLMSAQNFVVVIFWNALVVPELICCTSHSWIRVVGKWCVMSWHHLTHEHANELCSAPGFDYECAESRRKWLESAPISKKTIWRRREMIKNYFMISFLTFPRTYLAWCIENAKIIKIKILLIKSCSGLFLLSWNWIRY